MGLPRKATLIFWTVFLLAVVGACCLGAEAAEADLPVVKGSLPNGLTFLVKESHVSDIVAIEAFLRIPASMEEKGNAGIRELVQEMLLKGTETRTGDMIAQQLESVGGKISASVGLDYVEAYVVVTSEDFDLAIDLLADTLRHPKFDPTQFEKQRDRLLNYLASIGDDPFQENYLLFRDLLYGDHPYARSAFGLPASIQRLSREQVIEFHRRYYVPNNLVVAICGNVSPSQAKARIERHFADWPARKVTPLPEPTFASLTESQVKMLERPLQSACLMLGFAAPKVDDPDYPALQVANAILSGGMSSRLVQEIRDRRGLAYDVSSYYPTLAHTSHLVTYIRTNPASLETVKEEIVIQLRRLQYESVPDKELQRSKRFLIGNYALSHQRAKEQAYYLGWYEILEVGFEFDREYPEKIAAVSAEDVARAARKYFSKYALALLLPMDEWAEFSSFHQFGR